MPYTLGYTKYSLQSIKTIKLQRVNFGFFNSNSKNAVPLEAWTGPEGYRKLGLPDFMTTAQDGDKGVSLTHRPPLLPGNTPGTHFR